MSTFSNRTEREDMVVSQARRPCAVFASLGAAALSRTHRFRRGLHGVMGAFTLTVYNI